MPWDRLKLAPLAGNIRWAPVSPASSEEIARVHTAGMTRFLQEACAQGPVLLDHAPTYVTRQSWQAARRAAGGVLGLERAVLGAGEGEPRRGFALVRPPGHHAEPRRPMGFCLLNNIAIAAADALAHGSGRVAVVDFDAHHGNGTQAFALEEPRLGFFSSHQYGIYPGTGRLDEAPQARGRIINVPLPARAGDAAFTQMLDLIIAPWLAVFKPSLVLVSAGFDAHWSDPLTQLGVSTTGYYRLARQLVELADQFCDGRILFVLEGGYDPERLADNVAAVFYALADLDEPADQAGPAPSPEPDLSGWLADISELHHLSRSF